MIWVFNCNKASAASCNNYDELFQYITSIENLKFSANSSGVEESLNRIAILATPDIDMEAIKKQWCLEYCDAYNYIVVENFPHSCHSQASCVEQPL